MRATGYYTHALCAKHDMGEGHPECPQRLGAIWDRLLATGVADALRVHEAPAADQPDLRRAHDGLLLSSLEALCQQVADGREAGGPAHLAIDADTAVNAYTWQAALRAAGAVVAATDAVLDGQLENAFCAVRPPGHHACRSQAMGFCVINNVAVAALHALEARGLERVAIVDFDVHHGNGTQDIVAGDDRILMVGFFQHPLYPYCGTEPAASNVLNLPVPAYTRGPAIRDLIESHWMPRLEAFAPQLILISAGFDAHRDDGLGQLGLIEEDYAWITRRLKELAGRHAGGRIVSALEGGYHLPALARSVEAHVRVLADL
jgi:acetoin utilization deacetylase AcuC-like enzyme